MILAVRPHRKGPPVAAAVPPWPLQAPVTDEAGAEATNRSTGTTVATAGTQVSHQNLLARVTAARIGLAVTIHHPEPAQNPVLPKMKAAPDDPGLPVRADAVAAAAPVTVAAEVGAETDTAEAAAWRKTKKTDVDFTWPTWTRTPPSEISSGSSAGTDLSKKYGWRARCPALHSWCTATRTTPKKPAG